MNILQEDRERTERRTSGVQNEVATIMSEGGLFYKGMQGVFNFVIRDFQNYIFMKCESSFLSPCFVKRCWKYMYTIKPQKDNKIIK